MSSTMPESAAIAHAPARKFVGIKFFLSWWAYSFPVAAMTIATMVMYRMTGLPLFAGIAWLLLALLAAIIALLVVRTARAIAAGEICVED